MGTMGKNRKGIAMKEQKTMENKIPTYYYVCPFDGTYSGEMQYCGKVTGLTQITFDEINALAGSPILGERLQCPKCKRIFGWHQLKKKEDK